MKIEDSPAVFDVPEKLVWVNKLANSINQQAGNALNSCILVSHALNHVLTKLGYHCQPVRVTAAAFPANGGGASLGSEWGHRAAKKDHWSGHLAVLVEDRWLLDPTVDQVNKFGLSLPPLAIQLDRQARGRLTFLNINDCFVRYNLFHKQTGFSRAGDARPKHWKPLAEDMVCVLRREHPEWLKA